jgi:hypothetical protein
MHACIRTHTRKYTHSDIHTYIDTHMPVHDNPRINIGVKNSMVVYCIQGLREISCKV